MKEISFAYEENTRLDAEIRRILDNPATERERLVMLRELMSCAQTPLGQSHITYYTEQIHARKKARYKHRISILAIGIWLIYILYRTCLYAWQETELGPSILGTTSSQALCGLLLVPVVVLIYYVIRYLLSLKNK